MAYYSNVDEKISGSNDIKRHIIDSFMNGRYQSVAKLERKQPTAEYGESIARSYITTRDSPLLRQGKEFFNNVEPMFEVPRYTRSGLSLHPS